MTKKSEPLAVADGGCAIQNDIGSGGKVSRITIKIRLRDKHAGELSRQSRAVNFVWNYCNETQQKAARSHRKWLTSFDLSYLTSGGCRELNIHSGTITEVCRYYVESRVQHHRPWLRWRSRKSLGWVPFKGKNLTFDGQVFRFRKVCYEPMHLRDRLKPGMKIGAGSFNADSKGNWYINITVAVERAAPRPEHAVGVDLGLKTLAALSDGDKIEMPRFYRESEKALATAQRARKTKRARAIHAKARNRRKDFLHKASNALVQRYGTIIIGDVSPSKLAKTWMAKSVNDAGWAGFKQMLSYNALMHGGRVVEVSEAMTTQTCSACGCLPQTRPIGKAGLGIREWRCDECGAVHDRDVNAATNILRVGLDTLAEGVGAGRRQSIERDGLQRSSQPGEGVSL